MYTYTMNKKVNVKKYIEKEYPQGAKHGIICIIPALTRLEQEYEDKLHRATMFQ